MHYSIEEYYVRMQFSNDYTDRLYSAERETLSACHTGSIHMTDRLVVMWLGC